MILLVHCASTLYMNGVIWFVQIVHYPLLGEACPADFPAYEKQNTALTTWAVSPMLLEGATALLLFWFCPAGVSSWQLYAGLTLFAVIMVSTAFVQVPCHDVLTQGFNAAALRTLVTTNWIRTVAWTMRGLLVLAMVYAALR
jgi:hypothetical protein